MIDVDQFKTYNDRYGHPAGDKSLATVAAALKSAVNRPRDFIARYGGEDIVMLLPGSDPEGARTVAEAARMAVLDANIDHIDSPHGRVTVSLGVAAVVPRPGGTAAELLQLADDALYAAKNAGRNRVMVSAGGRWIGGGHEVQHWHGEAHSGHFTDRRRLFQTMTGGLTLATYSAARLRKVRSRSSGLSRSNLLKPRTVSFLDIQSRPQNFAIAFIRRFSSVVT